MRFNAPRIGLDELDRRILRALEVQPRVGYNIYKEIGTIPQDDSTVYARLKKLSSMNLVDEMAGGSYRVTDEGRRRLHEFDGSWIPVVKLERVNSGSERDQSGVLGVEIDGLLKLVSDYFRVGTIEYKAEVSSIDGHML